MLKVIFPFNFITVFPQSLPRGFVSSYEESQRLRESHALETQPSASCGPQQRRSPFLAGCCFPRLSPVPPAVEVSRCGWKCPLLPTGWADHHFWEGQKTKHSLTSFCRTSGKWLIFSVNSCLCWAGPQPHWAAVRNHSAWGHQATTRSPLTAES